MGLRKIVVLGMILLLSATVFSNVELSGKVTDSAGKGIEGVTVSLVGKDLSTETDADGRYQLLSSTAISNVVAQRSGFSITGNRLSFSDGLTGDISVELFSVNGRRVSVLYSGSISENVNLNTHNISNGVYFMAVTVNGSRQMYRQSLIGGSLSGIGSTISINDNSAVSSHRGSRAADRLIFSKEGYVLQEISIDSYTAVIHATLVSKDNTVEDTTLSHGKSAQADYERVFPDDTVNRLDVVISADNWTSMLENMTNLYGDFGDFGASSGRPVSENPIWVESEVTFQDKKWEHVGIRFKGNSTLQGAWSRGSYKLPFKLDFDQFEDIYPEVTDQRFYGFKQLSLGSNFKDNAFVREKIAGDLYRNAGLKSPTRAYYELHIDYGEGSKYFGLYTLVEVPGQDFLDDQFGNSSGNLYKPDGINSHYQAHNIINKSSFPKKTNKELMDWSDITRLQTNLNLETRTTDASQWRDSVNAILNTDTFIKWLAVNTTMTNWDTYGVMHHNYYLYADSSQGGRLSWIPWDNNEAMTAGGSGLIAIDLSNIKDTWPLITYIRDDSVYMEAYWEQVSQFTNQVFIPGDIQAIIDEDAQMIQPYIEAEIDGYRHINDVNLFTTAISDLKSFVSSRQSSVLSSIPQ